MTLDILTSMTGVELDPALVDLFSSICEGKELGLMSSDADALAYWRVIDQYTCIIGIMSMVTLESKKWKALFSLG